MGIRQDDLAARTGTTQSRISNIERWRSGDNPGKALPFSLLLQIGNVLGLSVQRLIWGEQGDLPDFRRTVAQARTRQWRWHIELMRGAQQRRRGQTDNTHPMPPTSGSMARLPDPQKALLSCGIKGVFENRHTPEATSFIRRTLEDLLESLSRRPERASLILTGVALADFLPRTGKFFRELKSLLEKESLRLHVFLLNPFSMAAKKRKEIEVFRRPIEDIWISLAALRQLYKANPENVAIRLYSDDPSYFLLYDGETMYLEAYSYGYTPDSTPGYAIGGHAPLFVLRKPSAWIDQVEAHIEYLRRNSISLEDLIEILKDSLRSYRKKSAGDEDGRYALAALTMGFFREADMYGALMDMIDGGSPEVQCAALDALSRLSADGDSFLKARVIALLKTSGDEAVRLCAINCLTLLAGKNDLPLLQSLLATMRGRPEWTVLDAAVSDLKTRLKVCPRRSRG
jgi:hypothetical protein